MEFDGFGGVGGVEVGGVAMRRGDGEAFGGAGLSGGGVGEGVRVEWWSDAFW